MGFLNRTVKWFPDLGWIMLNFWLVAFVYWIPIVAIRVWSSYDWYFKMKMHKTICTEDLIWTLLPYSHSSLNMLNNTFIVMAIKRLGNLYKFIYHSIPINLRTSTHVEAFDFTDCVTDAINWTSHDLLPIGHWRRDPNKIINPTKFVVGFWNAHSEGSGCSTKIVYESLGVKDMDQWHNQTQWNMYTLLGSWDSMYNTDVLGVSDAVNDASHFDDISANSIYWFQLPL